MRRLDVVAALYDFVRSPTGRRMVEELKRHAADPRSRRRLTEMVKRVRTGRRQPIVVDADPPDH